MSPPPASGSGKQVSKIGWTPGQAPNRTKPTPSAPAPDQGSSETRSFVDTYFTKIPDVGDPPQVLYNGDRQWAKITLTLETAGPVSVGTIANLDPVLGGAGILLPTGIERTFTIAKGTRLYVLATGVNRIKRVVEPLPWLEQITGSIASVIGAIQALVRGR